VLISCGSFSKFQKVLKSATHGTHPSSGLVSTEQQNEKVTYQNSDKPENSFKRATEHYQLEIATYQKSNTAAIIIIIM